jgi:hypothetical protein
MSYRGLACVMLALAVMPNASRAEDYCDTSEIDKGIAQSKHTVETVEKAIRAKCKTGDIIWVDGGLYVAKLCDLHQTVVAAGSLGAGFVCFLAPPRRTY